MVIVQHRRTHFRGPPTDPYFANVRALLHLNGTDGSTTITDVKGHSFTTSGNAQIDTAESKYGGASAMFDGSGDYISGASNDFLLGAGNHTLEFWIKNNDPTGARTACSCACMGVATNYWQVILKSGAIRLNRAIAGVFADDFVAVASLDNTWHHFAWTKSGSTNTFWLDGTSLGTWSRSDWGFVTANTLYIGANYNAGSTGIDGWIDDFRLTIGTARYTSNFTPPTAEFPDA